MVDRTNTSSKPGRQLKDGESAMNHAGIKHETSYQSLIQRLTIDKDGRDVLIGYLLKKMLGTRATFIDNRRWTGKVVMRDASMANEVM